MKIEREKANREYDFNEIVVNTICIDFQKYEFS